MKKLFFSMIFFTTISLMTSCGENKNEKHPFFWRTCRGLGLFEVISIYTVIKSVSFFYCIESVCCSGFSRFLRFYSYL